MPFKFYPLFFWFALVKWPENWECLESSLLVCLWTVMVSVLPQQIQPWLTCWKDYEQKWAMWWSAQLLDHVKLQFGCTPHLFWPCLAGCALAQISSPFVYTPGKQPCKADTASFDVLKNFAIYLQDQRDCNFQASHYEIPTGVDSSCFFSKRSSAFFLSLNSSQCRVLAKSIDVLKLSRERRDSVYFSVGLMLFWIYFSCRNAAFIHTEKLFVAPYGFSVKVTGTHYIFVSLLISSCSVNTILL